MDDGVTRRQFTHELAKMRRLARTTNVYCWPADRVLVTESYTRPLHDW